MLNLQDYIDKPLELFKKLHLIWRNEIGESNKKTSSLILELNVKYNVDVLDYALKAINEGFGSIELHNILEDSIPLLKLNVISTHNYLEKIYECMQDDFMHGRQYEPIANMAKAQPEFARTLLYDLIGTGKPFIVGYVSEIFSNIPNSEIEALHTEVFSLLTNAAEPVLNAAVITLGNLKYNIDHNIGILEKTLNAFDELLDRKSDIITQSVVYSLCQLQHVGVEAKSRILNLSKMNDEKIQFIISRFLSNHSKKISDMGWFEDVLMTLSATRCDFGGIISNIDNILFNIMQSQCNHNLVEHFLTEWLINSNFQESNQKLDSLFGLTLSRMLENVTFFNSLVTKYFNHDNSTVNLAASELINYWNMIKNEAFFLDQLIISSLDMQDILYVSRKILGYVYDAKTLCSLFYSILTAKSNDLNVKELICDIFLNQISIDFPGTPIQFLNEELSKKDLFCDIAITLQDIINKLNSRENIYKSIPLLNELLTPQRMQYQITLEESKNMSRLMEEAQKGSITSLFTNKIPLKYGRSWFCYNDGKYSSPNLLSSFSHSMEIPMSEIFNPVSASIKRTSFKMVKRGVD